MKIRIGDKIIWPNAKNEVFEIMDINLFRNHDQILWSYKNALGEIKEVWACEVDDIEKQLRLFNTITIIRKDIMSFDKSLPKFKL